MERWNTSQIWQATDNPASDLRELQLSRGMLIELEDSGSADSQIVVRHKLNRTPIGLRVINAILPSAGDCIWYRLDEFDTWDEREIRIRFRVANARVLLEVF